MRGVGVRKTFFSDGDFYNVETLSARFNFLISSTEVTFIRLYI